MCGIFGFVSGSISYEKKHALLKAMGDKIVYRGPDDDGYAIHDNCALGMRRLSIIDLETGKQPIYNSDKTLLIIFNGEIYNYRKLRTRLLKEGCQFKTKTDTEVILKLYQVFGERCLNELNGMFSFAIYDITQQRLFIARDRFGIKPLYYSFQNNHFVFASELKSLLIHPEVKKSLSLESIDLYLSFEHIPAPYTIYKNIHKLEQGHYLIFKDQKLTNITYYQFSFKNKKPSINATDYLDELDHKLNAAVNRRTISDVPLGAFLSGGIDSSLICNYLVQNSNKRVQTFSIGFEEESFDESNFAMRVANYLDTEHHQHIFSSKKLIETLPNIITNMDEPFADPSLLPTFLLSQYTRKYVTVALSGDGSDELFAGYPTYLARKIARFVPKWSYQPLLSFVNKLPVNDDNISLDFKIKRFSRGLLFDPDLRHQVWLGCFDPKQKTTLFSYATNELLKHRNLLDEIIHDHMTNCDTENNWERSLWIDLRFYLQDNMLVKVDRASMMNSLEVRVPFLDHIVVEYVNRIPASLKYKGTTSKFILKQLASRYLPEDIINRPKKGFGIPVAKWFKKELKPMLLETLSIQNLNKHQLFNPTFIQSLITDHLKNRSDNRKELWTLFIFQLWYNQHHDA